MGLLTNEDAAVEIEVNLGVRTVMRGRPSAINAFLAGRSVSSRRLFAAAIACTSLGAGCGGNLRGVPEDGGTSGSDAYATDAGADADASAPSNDAGLDATPDGTLLDGNVLDDASTSADAADSSAASEDASSDAASDVTTDAASDATTDAGDDASTVILATDVTSAALAIDDTNVYFTTADGAGVSGVPKTGGPMFVVAQPAAGVSGGQIHLYLEGALLYWDPASSAPGNPSTLLSVPAAARNVPATVLGSFGVDAEDFAVSGGTAYAGSAVQDVTTLSTIPDAGPYTWLFSANEMELWLSFQLDAENGTFDGLEPGSGQVDRILLDGGAMTSISIEANANVMAIHVDAMYSIAFPACNPPFPDGGCISTMYTSALDGSNTTLVASGPWPFPSGDGAEDSIGAITATYAFLHVEGGIVRVTLATGENHVVYSYLGSDPTAIGAPGSVAADDDFLYVVDPSVGLVRVAN